MMKRRGRVLTATAMGQITSQPIRYSLAGSLASLLFSLLPAIRVILEKRALLQSGRETRAEGGERGEILDEIF